MKDRRTILYLVILSMFLLSMMALLAYADTGMSTRATSSALYNPDTKAFLYQSNADQRLPMASTTKIVTALIAIESLNLDETVRVPKEAVGVEGSSLYLKEGDELTVKDLVYGVLLQSANDAATVLALRISGSISAFAEKMNERVAIIGVTDTNFENPHGLDSDGHYTTAHDLSLIASEALSNNTFKDIASTYKYSFKLGDGTRTVVNHNKLLKTFDGCIGVKTGFTKRSGRCLVSAAVRNGITLVAVTLDDPDDWRDHQSMLEYGFDSLESIDITSLVTLPDSIPAISVDYARVKITLSKRNLVKTKEETVSCSLDLPPYITTDVKAGDRIGAVHVAVNGRQETVDIIASNDVSIKRIKRRFF